MLTDLANQLLPYRVSMDTQFHASKPCSLSIPKPRSPLQRRDALICFCAQESLEGQRCDASVCLCARKQAGFPPGVCSARPRSRPQEMNTAAPRSSRRSIFSNAVFRRVCTLLQLCVCYRLFEGHHLQCASGWVEGFFLFVVRERRGESASEEVSDGSLEGAPLCMCMSVCGPVSVRVYA